MCPCVCLRHNNVCMLEAKMDDVGPKERTAGDRP